MAVKYSYKDYTGDGVTTDYTVPTPYILQAHIRAFIDGVETTAFTWLTASQIRFTEAPAEDAFISIERQSSRAVRVVNWSNPGAMSEEELNQDSQQAFFLAQEAIDIAERGMVTDLADGKWDAGGLNIKDVADGVDPGDAVNKSQLDALSVETGNVPSPADPGDDGKYLRAEGGSWSWQAGADTTLFLQKSNNLSDLGSAPTARSNLGLGTAATRNTGTGQNNVPLLNADGKLQSTMMSNDVLDAAYLTMHALAR